MWGVAVLTILLQVSWCGPRVARVGRVVPGELDSEQDSSGVSTAVSQL